MIFPRQAFVWRGFFLVDRFSWLPAFKGLYSVCEMSQPKYSKQPVLIFFKQASDHKHQTMNR